MAEQLGKKEDNDEEEDKNEEEEDNNHDERKVTRIKRQMRKGIKMRTKRIYIMMKMVIMGGC